MCFCYYLLQIDKCDFKSGKENSRIYTREMDVNFQEKNMPIVFEFRKKAMKLNHAKLSSLKKPPNH